MTAGVTVIGRQAGVDIHLDHSHVSRRHVQLDRTAVSCAITDLGSSNGTKVNGEKLAPHAPVTLEAGAIIQIGPFTLIYEQRPVQPAPVGSFPAEASPYEALDMAGNVWEWVADWYDSGYYNQSPGCNPSGPNSGVGRVLRGGSLHGRGSPVALTASGAIPGTGTSTWVFVAPGILNNSR